MEQHDQQRRPPSPWLLSRNRGGESLETDRPTDGVVNRGPTAPFGSSRPAVELRWQGRRTMVGQRIGWEGKSQSTIWLCGPGQVVGDAFAQNSLPPLVVSPTKGVFGYGIWWNETERFRTQPSFLCLVGEKERNQVIPHKRIYM
jgi:hypothetical protein